MEESEQQPSPEENLEVAMAAELALIAEEQRSARRLLEAEIRLEREIRKLDKAQKRVKRRAKAVESAEVQLSEARERRIAGAARDVMMPEPQETDPGSDRGAPARD